MRRQTEKTTSSARTPSLAEIESLYVCLMLRDSQEDEEEEEEEEEGNSCKPHIMRPSVRPPFPLSVRPDSGAAEILACRRHYSAEGKGDLEGREEEERSEKERERGEMKGRKEGRKGADTAEMNTECEITRARSHIQLPKPGNQQTVGIC